MLAQLSWRHQGPGSSRSAARTPNPTMMAGRSRTDPTTRLATTTITTGPEIPTAEPATKATTATHLVAALPAKRECHCAEALGPLPA